MKTLIVGGAGFIGAATAYLLRSRGHDVTIAGRTPPAPGSPLADFDYARIDYTQPEQDAALLGGFDGLIFSAGNDVRHKPAQSGDEHWQSANALAIPRFFAAARAAGIKRAVNVGSFYTLAAPHLIETNPYIRSRRDAELGIAALAGPGFAAMSVNAPLVIGIVEGVSVPFFDSHVRFALGELAPMPEFVPPGGVNFISVRSLAEAIVGGLERGEGGKIYLVGDENLTFQQYFGAYFAAAGRAPPPVLDEEAPIFPDRSIYFGRGNTVFYEPDPEETRLLGYRRGDVIPSIHKMVAAYLQR
ncbi:MAG: NAD-dependent epimerase/dehydratase family protein [Sphingomonadales bacterium]|nr:MAG: NAD-dependent epimerase/dehydratase family protein [Sphingomonadales bacterium]